MVTVWNIFRIKADSAGLVLPSCAVYTAQQDNYIPVGEIPSSVLRWPLGPNYSECFCFFSKGREGTLLWNIPGQKHKSKLRKKATNCKLHLTLEI